jgi:FkbM family methyltransferase
MKPHQDRFNDFFSNGGDNKHLFNFPLNSLSVIFDVGSFDGEYFNIMYKKYKCKIHAFEPVESFYTATNIDLPESIKLNNFALGAKDDTFTIAMSGNSSSAFLEGNRVECKTVKFIDYIQNNEIDSIDLLKINCEGGEYELLEAILDSNYVSNVDNILVQFHYLSDNPESRRQAIVEALEKTHDVIFSYPFVWEYWKLKAKS